MELFEPSNKRQASSQLIWFLVWLGVTSVALYLTPDPSGHGTHQQLGMPPCPSVLLFDRPCPGCGLTTSWTALVHGQLGMAFRAHPLGPIFYAFFTAGALLGMYGWIKNLRLQTDARWANIGMTAFVAIFLGFGALRMAFSPGFAVPSERWLSHLASSR
jgi:hypothetical protein